MNTRDWALKAQPATGNTGFPAPARDQRHAPSCARRIRADGLRDGLGIAAIIEAIVACCQTSRLTGSRIARGWTLSATAERMNELRRAEAPGTGGQVTAQMLCAWEHGRAVPTLASVELLCRCFNAWPTQLGLVRDYVALTPPRALGADVSAGSADELSADELPTGTG